MSKGDHTLNTTQRLLAGTTLLLAAGIGFATGGLSVTREATPDAPPATAWKLIGNFQGLDVWQPALANRANAMQLVAQRIQDTDVVEFLMQNLVPRDDHFDWCVNLGAISAQLAVLSGFPGELLLKRYQGPTTLIRGSLSDYVQHADRTVFQQAFPHLQVIDIKGAGHWVHTDKPVEFLAALALASAPADRTL